MPVLTFSGFVVVEPPLEVLDGIDVLAVLAGLR